MATPKRRKPGGEACSAIKCSNARWKAECAGMSFFRFPKEETRCRIWVQNSRRDDLIGKTGHELNKGGYLLCSKHFEPNQFNRPAERNHLTWNAIPTLFDVPNPPPSVTTKRPAPRDRSSSACSMAKKQRSETAHEQRKRSVESSLNEDDVTNQGRVLLNEFIAERMKRDGILNAPVVEDLQEPGTPCGPPMDHYREIGRAMRCIGDELDRDQKLQDLIKKVPPEAERKTFFAVARKIFEDGVFNWGRVIALFYFAYKVSVKALDRIPLIRAVVNLIVEIIHDLVAHWIVERGGWEAIREYFGSTWKQLAAVAGAGVVIAAGIYLVGKC